jgi:AcrR family transcriptional regulator
MAMIERLNSPNEDIEALLPWYEKGTLPEKEARLVEDYLAGNPDRARFLALIREEMMETVEANERSGMPSSAAFNRLMDSIAAEPKARRMAVRERAGGLFARLFGLGASPWLVAGAAAACLVIMVQAAALGVLMMRGGPGDDPSRITLASGPAGGSFALVRVKSEATIGDISTLLRSFNATIVDGPKPGGIYKLKLSSQELTGEQIEETLRQMRARSDIISPLAGQR